MQGTKFTLVRVFTINNLYHIKCQCMLVDKANIFCQNKTPAFFPCQILTTQVGSVIQVPLVSESAINYSIIDDYFYLSQVRKTFHVLSGL